MKKKLLFLLLLTIPLIWMSCSSDDNEISPDSESPNSIVGDWILESYNYDYLETYSYVGGSQGKDEGSYSLIRGTVTLRFEEDGVLEIFYENDAVFEDRWIGDDGTEEVAQDKYSSRDNKTGRWKITDTHKLKIDGVLDLIGLTEIPTIDILSSKNNRLKLHADVYSVDHVYEYGEDVSEGVLDMTLKRNF